MRVLIQVWIGYYGYNSGLLEPFICNWINDYGILKRHRQFRKETSFMESISN